MIPIPALLHIRCTQAGIYFKALFTTAHIRVHLDPTGVRLKCNFHLPMRLSLKKRDSSAQPLPFPLLIGLAYVFVQEIFRWMSLQILVDHKICLMFVSKISSITGDLDH